MFKGFFGRNALLGLEGHHLLEEVESFLIDLSILVREILGEVFARVPFVGSHLPFRELHKGGGMISVRRAKEFEDLDQMVSPCIGLYFIKEVTTSHQLTENHSHTPHICRHRVVLIVEELFRRMVLQCSRSILFFLR